MVSTNSRTYKDTGLDAPRPKFEADAKLEAAGLSTNASSILVTLSKVSTINLKTSTQTDYTTSNQSTIGRSAEKSLNGKEIMTGKPFKHYPSGHPSHPPKVIPRNPLAK